MNGWRAISERMKTHPAAFVLGVPRSGTTILRNTLARLPSFRAAPCATVETRIFVEPERVLAPFAPEATRVLKYLNQDATAAERLAEAALAAADDAEAPAIPSRASAALTKFLHDRHDHLVRLFFHFGLEANGGKRVLEKTPRHMYHLDEIRETFPEARVLMCLRHPVDVYSSYRKKLRLHERHGRVEERHQWLRIKPKLFGERYAAWTQTMLDHAELHDDTCRVVRYERLTEDPRGEVEQVCEFLGEPFRPELLFDEIVEARDGAGSPRPTTRLTTNDKRWRDHLSEDDARKVEFSASAALTRLGYERYAPESRE